LQWVLGGLRVNFVNLSLLDGMRLSESSQFKLTGVGIQSWFGLGWAF